MTFQLDVNNIKIASSSEDAVSKTIEELLELNKRIPKRTGEEVMHITEKQLDLKNYPGKINSGITEKQMGKRDKPSDDILEIKLEENESTKGGHRSESWDKDKEESRGHKNVSPLWLQVHKQEDDRKKLDKGQLDKKQKKSEK